MDVKRPSTRVVFSQDLRQRHPLHVSDHRDEAYKNNSMNIRRERRQASTTHAQLPPHERTATYNKKLDEVHQHASRTALPLEDNDLIPQELLPAAGCRGGEWRHATESYRYVSQLVIWAGCIDMYVLGVLVQVALSTGLKCEGDGFLAAWLFCGLLGSFPLTVFIDNIKRRTTFRKAFACEAFFTSISIVWFCLGLGMTVTFGSGLLVTYTTTSSSSSVEEEAVDVDDSAIKNHVLQSQEYSSASGGVGGFSLYPSSEDGEGTVEAAATQHGAGHIIASLSEAEKGASRIFDLLRNGRAFDLLPWSLGNSTASPREADATSKGQDQDDQERHPLLRGPRDEQQLSTKQQDEEEAATANDAWDIISPANGQSSSISSRADSDSSSTCQSILWTTSVALSALHATCFILLTAFSLLTTLVPALVKMFLYHVILRKK
ncbi:unnamed protein product [Amoebophrya sp. A25]|nr:unnamed protein product [Amoebophrya sp. A25]|eukprot:GSA25T00010963001.1